MNMEEQKKINLLNKLSNLSCNIIHFLFVYQLHSCKEDSSCTL